MKKTKDFILSHPKTSFLIVSIVLSFISVTFGNGISSFLYSTFRIDPFTSDPDFFYFTGSLLLKGKIPYIDFFDHKGLYVFYFHALGELLGGRVGLYFLELVWLIPVFYFFALTCDELRFSKKLTFLMSLFFVTVLIAQFSGGSDEEVELPFISLALYFYIRALNRSSDKDFMIGNILWGVSAGVCLNLRPSDCMFALSAVIFYGVHMLTKRRYLIVLRDAALCVGAIIVVSIPPYVHAISQGFLTPMFDAVILSNFSYIASAGGSTWVRYFCWGLLTLGVVLFSYVEFFLNKKIPFAEWQFYFISMIVVFPLQFAIARFTHYWILAYPFCCIMLGRYLQFAPWFTNSKRAFRGITSGVLATLCALCVWWPAYYYVPGQDKVDKDIYNVLREAIPESSRDGRTIGIDVENGVYLLGDITPDYKDYAMQSWHSRFDETLIPRLEEYLYSGDVDYVLLPAVYDGESYRLPLRDFILDNPDKFVQYHPSCGDCPTIMIFKVTNA